MCLSTLYDLKYTSSRVNRYNSLREKTDYTIKRVSIFFPRVNLKMSSKKDIQSALSLKGIKYDSSMKKDVLEKKLKAAEYISSNLSRKQLEDLTVPILKELLVIKEKSTKGLKTKEDYINANVSLNPELVMEEKQKKEEITEKLKNVPLDALRLAMQRLTIPEQMKASIAFSDKEMVHELQTKRLNLPNLITVYDDDDKEKVIYTKNLSKYDHQKIKNKFASMLNDNLTWTLENEYLSVKRFIVQEYRGTYIMNYIIQPKNSSLKIKIRHYLGYREKPLEYYISEIRYYISFDDTYNIEQLINDMNYIRIGIHWIESYGGYKVIPKFFEVYFDQIPHSLNLDPNLKSKYIKLFIKELKRVKF